MSIVSLELNKQPIEQQHLRDDGALEIVSVFDTIQGEGPFAGVPAVFVRTAGCDLLCPHCDSDYTTNRRLESAVTILSQIQEKRKDGLVVITGGEPLRQNIGPLCDLLLANNYTVQIETNGTLFVPGVPYSRITIVCSPKTPELNPFLKTRIDYLKYVVEHGQIDETDGLPITALGRSSKVIRPWSAIPKDRVFVQPLDQMHPELNHLNTQAAVQSCMKFGWRLCLQLHKYLGLD